MLYSARNFCKSSYYANLFRSQSNIYSQQHIKKLSIEFTRQGKIFTFITIFGFTNIEERGYKYVYINENKTFSTYQLLTVKWICLGWSRVQRSCKQIATCWWTVLGSWLVKSAAHTCGSHGCVLLPDLSRHRSILKGFNCKNQCTGYGIFLNNACYYQWLSCA